MENNTKLLTQCFCESKQFTITTEEYSTGTLDSQGRLDINLTGDSETTHIECKRCGKTYREKDFTELYFY